MTNQSSNGTSKPFAENKISALGVLIFSTLSGIIAGFTNSPILLLGVIFAVAFFALLLFRLHWGIYVLLLVASIFSAISFELNVFTIRPDQVITLLLAIGLLLFSISGRRPFVSTSLDWLILSYLLLNVVSSLLHSPDVKTSLQRCLLLAITFGAFFVSTQLIQSRRIFSRVFYLLLAIGIVEAIYGILSVFLIRKGIDIGGAYFVYNDIYAKGTFLEGNIFGSFEMLIGLLLSSFLLSPYFKSLRGIILLILVPVLIACLMSFTRAAWLGFLIGSSSFVFFNWHYFIRRIQKALILIVAVFTFLFAGVLVLSIEMRSGSVPFLEMYANRILNLVQYRYGTGGARLQAWKYSLEFWQKNPIIGNGTDSIKALAKGTAMPLFGDEYWIPNSMILALHDTGVLGLICFCLIQSVFLWKLLSARKRTVSAYDRAFLEGCFAAFIGIQIAYFFTNAFWLIFIWVFMGIGIAGCRLAENRERRLTEY